MDFKNAPKKRTTNFREDETKLLIQLWGSPTIQNKLYLTHRKAPVMKLIAKNMQKHGFYRTPDEIKTRIRNLKCLYHRIKKSMITGTIIGTVDPDWPHYKAMDEILSRRNSLRQNLVYNHNLLSEVNAELKEEIDDIEINDDGESSNSNGTDDEFDETPSAMPATITPLIIEDDKVLTPVKIAPKLQSVSVPTTNYPRIQIAQNLLPTPPPPPPPLLNSMGNVRKEAPKLQTVIQNGTQGGKNLPFPLLILNGGQNGTIPKSIQMTNNVNQANGNQLNSEVCSLLKELLTVQKENLQLEKERLEIEKQKFDYERTIGSQLLNLVPTFNEMFQRFSNGKEHSNDSAPAPCLEMDLEDDSKNFAEHPKYQLKTAKSVVADSPLSELKNNKLFKDVVLNGIKKYMQDGQSDNEVNS